MRLQLGVLLTAALVVVTGLSSAYAGTARATPKYDDNATVVVAGATLGVDLDPHKPGGTLSGIVDLYDTLLHATPQSKLVPSLAESWKYSADNLTLTLTLRQGVKFSDGSLLDGAAVVASLNRARSGPTSQFKVVLSSITQIAAPDSKTVVITLVHPDAALLAALAGPSGMIINPKMITDNAAILKGAAGIGTGPYTVTSFVVGQKVVMARNENYWDASAIKHAPKTYEFDLVGDGGARMNGLLTKQYTAIQSTGTPGLTDAVADPSKNLVDTAPPASNVWALGFRLSSAPFDNEKVRLAVAHALELKPTVAGLLADEMNCVPTPVSQVWVKGTAPYDPKLATPLSFDLRKAKALMAEAGYPDGKGFPTVEISASSTSGDSFAAQAFQGQLARIGINVTVAIFPTATTTINEFLSGKAALTTRSINSTSIDPSLVLDDRVFASNFVDAVSDTGKQIHALADQAKVTVDPAKRVALFRQITTLVKDHAMFVPFCQAKNGYAHVSTISGFENSNWIRLGISEARYITTTKK